MANKEIPTQYKNTMQNERVYTQNKEKQQDVFTGNAALDAALAKLYRKAKELAGD